MRLALPPDYALVGADIEDEEDEAEREAFRLSTNRALGIWHAPRPYTPIDPRRGPRSWALHLTPREGYPTAGISPPPIVVEEYECSLASLGGRVWNVITYVYESPEDENSRELMKPPFEFKTHFHLSAYSKVRSDLYVTANGGGWRPDAEAEALAILRSIVD